MHIIDKTLTTYEYDYTDHFDTQFRPLPEIVAYDTYLVDLNSDLNPIGMKNYMIKTKWSTKTLTTNLMIKLKAMT